MYRSLLYVPASSERFIAKAAQCAADAIILDLEDSVAPNQKKAARDNLGSSIRRCAESGADVWVSSRHNLQIDKAGPIFLPRLDRFKRIHIES